MAVAMRDLSSYKDERMAAYALYQTDAAQAQVSKQEAIQLAGDALYFATLICYAQGLAMLHKASTELAMEIPLANVVKIWRGGCIIRSTLLEAFYQAYAKNQALPNILLDEAIAGLIKQKEAGIRRFLTVAAESRIPVGGLASALAYFDAYTSAAMPVNLIQAQRDYFGAHTYERIDKPGKFHTEWGSNG